MEQKQQYTCPMHPEIIQDKPGNCPKCGMNLVLLKNVEAESHSNHHGHSKSEMQSRHEQHTTPVVNIKEAKSFQKYTCPTCKTRCTWWA